LVAKHRVKFAYVALSYATFQAVRYSRTEPFGLGAANGRSETCMRFLALIGTLAIAVGIGAAAFFFGGF
jgi:hypothetical protein